MSYPSNLKVYKTLNLSNNDFIRTTEKRHHKAVNEIWNRLVKSNDIYLSKYSGWYSVSDEAYYDSDEIGQKITLKLQKFLDQEWSGLKKSLFLNYLPGKKNCLISINQILILFFQNHVEMKSLNL